MKRIKILFFWPLVTLGLLANAEISSSLRSISKTEAFAIVQTQEEAKERAKDAREAELLAADIVNVAIAYLGDKKVIFNRVRVSSAQTSTGATVASLNSVKSSITAENDFFEVSDKSNESFMLSGVVYPDGISEIWWDRESGRFRIFTNANFVYLTGLCEVENEDTSYLVFMAIGEDNSPDENTEGEWRPTATDFSPNAIEYYVVQNGDEAIEDPQAFNALEALLLKYSESHAEMKINYENGKKMREARKAYFEANPPKKRDTIINFRPTGKSVMNASN